MSYKVEELLALRHSVSESAVSLDRFADEEVIKEHVLRPSASATLASTASDKSLRASLTPALAPTVSYKKPSPSPSIKRRKAERLLKEHGSPPGIRVTAGGRVVPSDMPPLTNNRFVNNTFKPPTLRGAPIGNIMPPQSLSDTGNVPRLEVVNNQPVLFVGDRAYALPALGAQGPSPSIPPSIAASMENTVKPALPPQVLTARSSFNNATEAPPPASTSTPFSGLDLATLKTQQSLRKQELRTLEQTEVLQASHQTDAWRAGIIEKKRNLIVELDALRKQIAHTEAAGSNNNQNNGPTTQMNGFSNHISSSTAPTPAAPFVPHFQQPMPSPIFAYPGAAPYPPMVMFPPAFGGFSNLPSAEVAPFVPAPIQKPLSPGSASRRSHAIAIKPPQEGKKKQVSSALDPKSPTYEPVSKGPLIKTVAPPSPSPGKPSWRADQTPRSDKHAERSLSHKQSLSSIDTTDFFPNNTHEHSSTRVAPLGPEAPTKHTAVPATPEKDWPASPWNEGHSGRSSHKAVAKLTSWPEGFGKQPSMASLRHTVTGQASAAAQERTPAGASDSHQSAFTGTMTGRKAADQRTGTDENWSLMNSKPVNHVPSTYQEGYQAGYDHVGIPDSPEVIKGYIQGLIQFLSDENKKEHRSSLRGLVTGSTLNDSGVSMAFNRTDVPIGGHENVRSVKFNPSMDARRDSAFVSQAEAPMSYALGNETADARMQNSAMAMSSAVDRQDKASAYRQIVLTAAAEKNHQDNKGIVSRSESKNDGGTYPRQFSSKQLGVRPNGTPMHTRFPGSPNDYAANGIGTNMALSVRPFANHSMSGLDGAMEDLADLVIETQIDDGKTSAENKQSGDSQQVKDEEDASCFRPTSGRDKQKMASSPSKMTSERTEGATSSPVNTPGSPKKSGEVSPAKAKLEHVTNKFRRAKKDDPRNMSQEEKARRSQKWHKRFRTLRESEQKEIDKYNNNKNNTRNQ